MAFGEMMIHNYRFLIKQNAPVGGMYFFNEPICLIVDRALIKQVLTKDFPSFSGHGSYHQKKDVLTMNLFSIDGDYWKYMRTKLTPTFTSGKMKMMFETITEKIPNLENIVFKYAETNEAFAIKDVVARFTTDIIGTCGFGIECDSMGDANNDFRKYGKVALKNINLKGFLTSLLPWDLLANLGFRFYGREVSNFFSEIVTNTIKYREESKIFRKDFMHLMVEMKHQKVDSGYAITDEEIIAQCFVFFLGGFETSSTTMTFALLCLAQNQDIQEKMRQEINDQLSASNGKLTYDAIMTMPYLDKVVNETLRMYPPFSFLPRTCTKTFKVPNTNLVIEKGIRLLIPVMGVQMNPEFYPNPEIFDPERFSSENRSSRPDFTFLPFGEGPRMCIGLRFGLMQTKLGLVTLLRKFKFTINEKTTLPIRMDPEEVMLSVKGDVWLNATKVD